VIDRLVGFRNIDTGTDDRFAARAASFLPNLRMES
jgi:hypothetical protein